MVRIAAPFLVLAAVAAVAGRTMTPQGTASATKIRWAVSGKPEEDGPPPIEVRDRLHTHLYTYRRIALGARLNNKSKAQTASV